MFKIKYEEGGSIVNEVFASYHIREYNILHGEIYYYKFIKSDSQLLSFTLKYM